MNDLLVYSAWVIAFLAAFAVFFIFLPTSLPPGRAA